MASVLDGFVLRSPRTAPSNAATTADATNGVLRDVRALPGSYDLEGTAPARQGLVEPAGEQYRAAVLLNPDGSESVEFLVWAANSSSLTLLEDPSWAVSADNPGEAVSIITGDLSVTDGVDTRTDGTNRLIVRDPGGRGLASVRLITIVRGDTAAEVQVGPDGTYSFASQDADAGIVTLNAGALAALGGGVSKRRGDSILVVTYVIAAARFWWTRNDAFTTRFGWNGRSQKWEPFKGSAPTEVGVLTPGETYTLTPRPTRFSVGDYLPGDSGDPDVYSLIRIGTFPDRTATVPSVLVVADDALETHVFGAEDAIVGQTNGILVFSTAFAATNAGRPIWYSFEDFQSDSNGAIGDLLGALDLPLFLCPVPEPTDLPFIRLGFRRYLTAVAVPTDTDLPDQSVVPEGFVYWSQATGKLALSEVDILKADPQDASFDLQYLGNQVYYDGVSLTTASLRTRDPVQLVDNSGTPDTVGASNALYIPNASPIPTPGTSGVLFVPDGSGTLPNDSKAPTYRQNGSGLVRAIVGVGDTILFTPSGAIETIQVVDQESDLPDFPFAIRKGRAWVAKEEGTAGSRVALGLKDRARFGGEPMYFLQAEVQPAVYTSEARIYSRQKGPFTFTGAERLIFSVDGTTFVWAAPAGTYDATSVAASIDALLTTGSAYAERDRVVIEAANPASGTIEIGFGANSSDQPSTAFQHRDLSGAAALGFLPGWRVVGGSDNYLPDHGAGIGVYRSPVNKDRSAETPDFRARSTFDNVLFSESVGAAPQISLDFPPLQDVAGFDESKFFMLVDGLNQSLLENYIDVLYDFGENRFLWLEQGSISARVEAPTTTLALGNTGVVENSMWPQVASGNGLSVAVDGGTFTPLTLNEDFVLPGGGSLGLAQLVNLVGDRTATGSGGRVLVPGAVEFLDDNAEFLTDAAADYFLKILSGPNQGVYIIDSVNSDISLNVRADVPFASADQFMSWAIYEGLPSTVENPGIVADVQYTDFNHLLEEPFKVRALHSIGEAGSAPLTAVATEALNFGRMISLRFGLGYGSPEATLTALAKTKIGVMASGLSVPDILDPHFANDTFAIQVGSALYTTNYPTTGDGPLEQVGTVPSAVTGDRVQYDSTGALVFGDDTLADLEGSIVYFVQQFLPGALLASGEAEIDPSSGEVRISAVDQAAHTGEPVYFVEQMITEQQFDVFISPLNGTVYFRRPLRALQIVEVSYFEADIEGKIAVDGDGNPKAEITEFLPLFVRLEECTSVDSTTYSFNPTGRTVDANIEPVVWVGAQRQNYGNTRTASFDTDASQVFLSTAPTGGAPVRINYAVLEAFGGEESYSTSTTPVYRPPFFLDADVDTFALEGDRTSDFVPGQLLRVGATPLYIKSLTFDGTETTVEIFPPTYQEVGSRSPGNDLLSLISSLPVATDVDGTPTAGSPGFWRALPNNYEPVDLGMLSIIFFGDVTGSMVAGHILELGGYPFIVVGSTLSSDGQTTKVDVSTPFPKGFNAGVDAVRVSVRPVYPPNPTEFLAPSAFVREQGHELILFGETNAQGNLLPGRSLIEDVDYKVDPDTGSIQFIDPPQGPLLPGQTLYIRFAQLLALGPFLANGVLNYPRYKAKYSYVTSPSKDNQILGGVLVGTYTFRSPDSFYYRAVPLSSYLGEVAKSATAKVAAQAPSSGPTVSAGGAGPNYTQGRLGIYGKLRDLQDQDRAARVFISLYNGFILGFEQISETINGENIGDKDGKFRFFVGRDRQYPPPGYEDQITGLMEPRNVWSEVFFAASESIRTTTDDIIVDPETATQDATTLEVDGDWVDPFRFRFYIDQQNLLVQNDMDDVVLVRRRRPRLQISFPFPRITVIGEYKRMAEPHRLSRLFPELALAFSTTYPGLEANLPAGDPGFYTFRRMLEPPKLFKGEGAVFGSTFRQPIASLSNPAIGTISNVTDAEIRERLPRARIWAYSPTGFPDLDSAFSLATPTEGRPTVIATPLFLKDFPIDPDTGFPDFSRLASNSSLTDPITGGTARADLPDLSSGDQELSTPPWPEVDRKERILPQVAFGRPTGETFGVGNAAKTIGGGLFNLLEKESYGGVFVEAVQLGAIITFSDEDGNPIESSSDIVIIGEGELESSPFDATQGDTIFVIPPGSTDTSSMSDPPTVEELQEFVENQPNYRRGFDIGVQKRGGSFVDLTLPSFRDPSPFGMKELLGQRPPDPLTTIEADVEFVNTDRRPFNFPALQGQPTNDDGDYGIPYLGTRNTELDRLGSVADALTQVSQADSPSPQAVYPDEVLGSDGTVLAVVSGPTPPAALVSASDFTPVTTAGSYTPNSGIGDVQEGDILLVQTEQANVAAGAQGIIQIGAVGTNTVEPARFVTGTRRGDVIRYTLRNAMASVDDSAPYTAGVQISTVVAGLNLLHTFDFSSLGSPVLNNGIGTGTTGGLNNIWAPGTNNAVVLRIYQNGGGGSPGALVEEIVLTGGTCYGGGGSLAVVSGPTANNNTITVTTVGGPNFLANTGGPYDFSIDIDTYIDTTTSTVTGGALAVGSGNGSTTARVETDRLTFSERVDLSTALERNATTFGGSANIECSLAVYEVTASGTGGVTVNNPTSVNGGLPFTFLSRNDGALEVGTFTPAPAGLEDGTVKVMAFEGHGNVPLPTTGPFTFSAVPSSTESTAGTIANGLGTCNDGLEAIVDDGTGTTLVVASGSLSRVVPGDILEIRTSAAGDAAIKTGTYLIRHTIPESGSVAGAHEVFTSVSGGGNGWLDARFPKVLGLSGTSLSVSGLVEVPTSINPTGYNFPASGTLYILKSSRDLDQALVANYSGYSVVGDTATFTLSGGYSLGDGSGLTLSAFSAQVAANDPVSGMTFLPVGQIKGTFPDNNVVGFDNGGSTVGGLVNVTLSNSSLTGGGAVTYASGVDLSDSTGGAVSDLGVIVSEATLKEDSSVFVSDSDAPVYEGVALYLDLRGISNADWNTIHGTTGAVVYAPAIADKFETHDGSSTPGTGFLAAAGVFLEPSWPLPVQDLNDGVEKVVDNFPHSLTPSTVGMRDAASFGLGSSENVAWQVRRIRRFHDALDSIGDNLQPLRFAYETRRGTVASVSTLSLPGMELITFTAQGGGTQLGGFNDPDVNINAGDVIRFLDSSGAVIDTARIAAVTGATTLILSPPGFSESSPSAGDNFEIYLTVPPIPHEQSNQQLFELITDTEIIVKTAVPSTGEGGRAPTTNMMEDPSVTDWQDINGEQVQPGDIIIIDPAGPLEGPTGPASPQETGARPVGDQSVPDRGPGLPWVAGGPSELDDNRGWYRVTAVSTTTLEVTGVSEFTGSDGSDVVFGSSGQEFAVYPTISASGLTGTTEGQMDLRQTAPADGTNSYQGNFNSIEPFSYRIIRPTPLLSEAAVDLVLMHRERILSWLELIGSSVEGTKQGSYFVFQRDIHITDLGSPTDPDDGLGVYSNLLITTLSGLTSVAPFANVSDCLSVLDRRYWSLDLRLDRTVPPYSGGTTPYSSFESNDLDPALAVGSGRPVLPDLIDDVLDRDDRLRNLRFAWIAFRADQVDGSLFAADRFAQDIPRLLEEQEDFLRLKEGLDKL